MKISKKIDLNLIQCRLTLKDAIKRLSLIKIKTLIVLDNQTFFGTLTDGDIRRALLRNLNLKTPLKHVTNKKSIVTKQTIYDLKIDKLFKKRKIDVLPVIGKLKKFIGYHVYKGKKFINPIDFVIMAGGFGKRLLPYTIKTPKPLIKIKNKPMIEYIVLKAKKENFNSIQIITYYKSEQIKNFIKKKFKDVKVIKEKKPLGTIGGVKNLKINKSRNEHTIITNCDIFTSVSYSSIFNFHLNSNADLTVVTEMKKIQSPFGNIKLKNKKVAKFEEKPEHMSNIVVGIYIIRNSVLGILSKDKKKDMPEFINLLIKKKKKVVPYPITEKWIDIGTKTNLQNAKRFF